MNKLPRESGTRGEVSPRIKELHQCTQTIALSRPCRYSDYSHREDQPRLLVVIMRGRVWRVWRRGQEAYGRGGSFQAKVEEARRLVCVWALSIIARMRMVKRTAALCFAHGL